MARSFDGTSQYLSGSGISLTFPLTIHALVKRPTTDISTERPIVELLDSVTGSLIKLHEHISATGDSSPRCVTYDGTTGGTRIKYVQIAVGPVVNVWNSFCATFASSTSENIYWNGTDYNFLFTSGSTPNPTANELHICHFYKGSVAEVGVWNAALTQAEVTSLSNRFSPAMIRPQNLVHYVPMIGKTSPEIETVGGLSMALTGSPTTVDHPRIIYPHRRLKRTVHGGFQSRYYYDMIGQSRIGS